MAEKVTFDGPNKIIQVNYGETILDAQRDIYSAWKRWVLTPPSGSGIPYNSGYLQALRTVGGDPIGVGQAISPYFFLLNGWRLRSWNGDHFLTINGNIYVDESDGGGSPIIPPTQPAQVAVAFVVSPQSITNTVTVTAGALTPQDKQDISKGVWTESASSSANTPSGSFGELVNDTKIDTSLIPGTV